MNVLQHHSNFCYKKSLLLIGEDEYYDEDNAKFVPNNENESGAQYASHTLVNEAIQEN